MDLFEQHRQTRLAQEAPLAARMRPRTLQEYIGQDDILGPGRLLRRAIQADQLSSLLFYGPPGTGKTTLAQVIANTTKAHFTELNAVLAGVKDLRSAISAAQERRGQQGQKTILFVDEVHRFNKAQQDALLPWVENGTVTLIGATTENPYFEVNKALVSRSRVFQLKPLRETDLRKIAHQAIQDPQRGYGQQAVTLAPNALEHLVNVANGDARALLNALELAVKTTPVTDEQIYISLEIAEESIQQRAVLYDKEGDAHFDTISALIKSIRGSDPDAALYWLARMVYAGENPGYIFRRLVILAGEDVGLAVPEAMGVVNSCAQAFERVGMPEGRYPLAQAVLYLATCPKSHSAMGFFDALKAVERQREAEIPNPLRDPNRDAKAFGHGQGYLYPHAYRDHWVAQQYLPDSLQGQIFYQPSNQGYEAAIAETVARRREAQLAAELSQPFFPAPGLDSSQERWLQRTLGSASEQVRQICDRIYQILAPQPHHVLLDLKGGILTWEGLRQVPTGGVYARVTKGQHHQTMEQQARALQPLVKPVLIQTDLAKLPTALAAEAYPQQFDGIVGYGALSDSQHIDQLLTQLATYLSPTGSLVLAERIPARTVRIYSLLPPDSPSQELGQRLRQIEDSLYGQPDSWDIPQLTEWIASAGLEADVSLWEVPGQLAVTPSLKQRWLAPDSQYMQYLSHRLTKEEVERIRQALARQLNSQATIPWHTSLALVSARLRDADEPAHRAPPGNC